MGLPVAVNNVNNDDLKLTQSAISYTCRGKGTRRWTIHTELLIFTCSDGLITVCVLQCPILCVAIYKTRSISKNVPLFLHIINDGLSNGRATITLPLKTFF